MKEFKGLIKNVAQLSQDGVEAYFEREVTSFGNGAKVNCPKEYESSRAIIIILKENGKSSRVGRKQ